MNIFLGLSALFIFVQCNPIQKNWMPYLPGQCWDSRFNIRYGLFSGSRFLYLVYVHIKFHG
jgi:hypothetical protein